MNGPLRIATRKSALAMWQANHVRALLEQAHPGIHIELLPIVTRGDRILDRPLADIGGKGLFLKELERAMLDGEADLAVHSMKDVPAEMADGLVLAGLLPGDDASRRTAVRVTCVAWVAAALTMAFLFQAPVAMVLASGVAQAAMLGALAVAVLYFRYRDLDVRLAPGWRWDLLLWVSAAGFFVIAGWTVWQKVSGFFTAFL